jgi:hypothetical protein
VTAGKSRRCDRAVTPPSPPPPTLPFPIPPPHRFAYCHFTIYRVSFDTNVDAVSSIFVENIIPEEFNVLSEPIRVFGCE